MFLCPLTTSDLDRLCLFLSVLLTYTDLLSLIKAKSLNIVECPWYHLSTTAVWSLHKVEAQQCFLLNFRPQRHNILWNSFQKFASRFLSSGFQCRVLFSRDRCVQRLSRSGKNAVLGKQWSLPTSACGNSHSFIYRSKTSLGSHLLCLAWLDAFLLTT